VLFYFDESGGFEVRPQGHRAGIVVGVVLPAYNINAGGQIVGYGYLAGQEAAFLLTPVPESSALVLLGIGAVSLLACAWRRRGRTA